MHPAPSVILFSTLSGLGFGFLAFLGWGALQPSGWVAFFLWALGYGLAVAGLLASTFHLGNPKNALKAFTQWRTSWLSREAWASVATLVLLAPVALALGFTSIGGPVYLAVSALLNAGFLWGAWAIWRRDEAVAIADKYRVERKVFAFSLLYLFLHFVAFLLEAVLRSSGLGGW